MTLQEKILEALGEHALTGRQLYAALSGESAAAVDIALGQLMKRGLVTKDLGAYQRTNGKTAPARPTATAAPTAVVTAPSAAVSATPPKVIGPIGATQPIATKASKPAPQLTAREREVLELIGQGMTSKMIGDRLRTQKGNVDYWRWNACRKLGLKGKSELIAWLRKNPIPSAPSAVPALSGVPSREGALGPTVGAGLPSNRGAKEEAKPPATRFSPDLRARLIQVQQAKAEQLQWLIKLVDAAREELRSVEEMVRIATAEGMS